MRHTFTADVGIDETGDPEELTWDLFPVVDSALTTHLTELGVPALGSYIRPGMIVIGKIGKSSAYDAGRMPTCFEKQALSFDELRRQFGHMWVDTSVYAPDAVEGLVVETSVDGDAATVVIESPTESDIAI